MWIFPCFFGLAAAQKTTAVKKGKREEFAGLHQVAEVLEEFGSGKKRSVTRLGEGLCCSLVRFKPAR